MGGDEFPSSAIEVDGGSESNSGSVTVRLARSTGQNHGVVNKGYILELSLC